MSVAREMLLLVLLALLLVVGLVDGPAEVGEHHEILLRPGALKLAYAQAWEISNALERWSDFLVDGIQSAKPDEAELDRAFQLISDLIGRLCALREAQGEKCKYPGY